MKKLTIHVILVISMAFSFSIFSQELPEFVLPSPQAYEITKYGDMPVDESSGLISPSIPLYNYRVGELNLPISLSYSGNGVRITDLPTWTGNNWSLNAGGVISRVVKDLPDETSMPRIFYDEVDLQNQIYYQTVYKSCYEQTWYDQILFNANDFGNCDPPVIIPELSGFYLNSETRNLIVQPDFFDSQNDIYNFSFNGYSGSFFLDIQFVRDVNDQIVLDTNGLPLKDITAYQVKKETELKIEVLGGFREGSGYEFVITTPEGVKYFFGGDFAYEESQFVDRTVSLPVFGKRAKTAFYLTRIENYLGDVIQFEYHVKDEYEVLSIKNQTLTKGITIGSECADNSNTGISNLQTVKNIIFNGHHLKRIWSTSAPEIIISSEEVETSKQYYRVLSNIDFGDKIVDMEYWPTKSSLINSQSEDRFFLEAVSMMDKNSISKAFEYNFEYDDMEGLPTIDSFEQDYLGYYNGVSTNTNLLPLGYMKFFDSYFPQIHPFLRSRIDFSGYHDVLADREPNFLFSTKGSLKRIFYPTGGYTEIDYEPVQKKMIDSTLNMSIYSNMDQANPAWSPASILYSNFNAPVGIGDCLIAQSGQSDSEAVFMSQVVTFNILITTLENTGLDYHDYIYLEIYNCTNETTQEKRFNFPPPSGSLEGDPTNFSFSYDHTLIEGDSYTFKIGFGDNYAGHIDSNNTSSFSNTPMYVNASMTYITGYDEFDGLGLRVKRVKDYKETGEIAQTKRYYYNKAKDVLNTVLDLNSVQVYAPFFLNFSHNSIPLTDPIGGVPGICHNFYATLNSNAQSMILPNSGALNFYKNVTISYGGDDFENGGVEKQFKVVADNPPRDFKPERPFFIQVEKYLLEESFKLLSPDKTNLSWQNGTLDKEVKLMNKGNELYKISQIEYDYEPYENFKAKNMAGRKLENMNNLVINGYLYDLFFGLYDTYAHSNILQGTIKKEYIDPVPLSIHQPPILGHGWSMGDHDGDGVNNYNDPDFITPEMWYEMDDEEREAGYRQIITRNTMYYDNPPIPSLPIRTILYNSEDERNVTNFKYPISTHINEITGLLLSEEAGYYKLEEQHRISSPVEVETSLINENNIETVLSLNRTIYKEWGEGGKTLVEKIKTTKTGNSSDLEDRIKYISYDDYGNPREVKKVDGSSIIYFWSYNRNVIMKITNITYDDYLYFMSGTGITIEEEITDGDVNSIADLLPDSMVIKYNYIPGTNYISSIINPRGDKITYHYDEHYRLEYVKDKDGNILSKHEYEYLTQTR